MRISVGRPKGKRDLKNDLLRSIITLLSEKDISSISISDIAKKSNTTTAMFHYYFGNKSNLYHILVKEFAAPKIISILDSMERFDNAYECLCYVQDEIISLIEQEHSLVNLWARNILLGNKEFTREVINIITKERIAGFNRYIEEGQKKKQVNKNLKPSMLYYTIITATVLNFLNIELLTVDSIEHRKKHIQAFVRDAIKYYE